MTASFETANSYRLHPQVVHETIDGEVILIQIETGCYFSLGGSGTEIWALLMQGLPIESIVAILEHGYDADSEQLRRTVAALVEQLRSEALLEPAEGAASFAQTNGHLNGSNGSVRAALVPPVLEKYEDMQDFLLVDPIHEVDDEAGWPHKKNG